MIDESIWDEIDKVYNLPDREEDDIDAEQMAERYKSAMESARRRMRKMVETGKYYFVDVRDPTSANGKRRIIRLVKP